MKAAVFAYSHRGCCTARRVMAALGEAHLQAFAAARLEEENFQLLEKPSEPFYGRLFHWADAMIFVGSCGIAVREIAQHVQSKTTDPAVIVTDELGRFVIPLLSGHIGGANALAHRLADALGAVAVITTATDINCKFSVDTWAVEHGCRISSFSAAKALSAAILEREIPLMSEFPVAGALPSGVVPGEAGDVGIYIGVRVAEPFSLTLRLVPQVLHLGIGCRRGTPQEAIAAAAEQVMTAHRLDWQAVKTVASIDLKEEEPGLMQFCQSRIFIVLLYCWVSVEGDFTPSAFVSQVTGVDNVCERAAMVGAQTLLVRKTAGGGVTIAVAAEKWEVRFG